MMQMRISYLLRERPATYTMNKLFLDLLYSIVRLIVWCFVLFFIFQNVFGFNMSHLLVGAGVVGMAVAFAAQNTIANMFGAFSILGAKLFKVGDWIQVNGIEGSVEKIGFRSIRIRAIDSRIIDIPNRLVSDSQVENMSLRSFRREQFQFGLVYQTTPEQMKLALHILSEIGKDMADIMAEGKPVRFFFSNFGASSLDITGFVWFKMSDGLTMYERRDRFNHEVLRRFTEAGLDFAYPTTTVFLKRDDAPAAK